MVQNPCQHGDVAGFCAGSFEDSGGFGACSAGGEDIIDDEDAFAVDDLRILQPQRTALVFKALPDGDSFLRACLLRLFQQADVTGQVVTVGKLVGDDPRGIEIAYQTLPPVLWNRHDSVVLLRRDFRRSRRRQQRTEGSHADGGE